MRIALLVLVALIVVILLLALFQPADFRIERSVVIRATPAVIHAHVNDFRLWREWSPWEKMDPAMQRSYAGPNAGPGAEYAWDGNGQVGSGRMTITESRPAERIVLKLEFFKPMAATNTGEFTFVPTEGGTTVSWSMSGSNNFVGKLFCLFINMDKMVGGQFAEGLANLKKVAETAPPRL